ncbi:MAG TPA: methyltransferase domain-containing protein [Thermoanaerobaculia bacterium]|nr:methyltransferase domain-containing protein [Thermoanaerobaculia bacterium]
MSSGPGAYRDFTYPLNVFMHILTHEEGEVAYLHYGLFERPDEPLLAAQERSTELLMSRLPSPPARLLEVGIGLGTTMAKLGQRGYDVTGITPDASQIEMVRARHPRAEVQCVRFEDFSGGPFDAVFFQESSQYIDSNALFAKARELTSNVIVLDEFAITDEGTLHRYSPFLDAARANGFEVLEDLDVSEKAPPTMEYFMARIPCYRERLVADLGLTSQQIDDLLASGRSYVDLYRRGVYAYRLLRFRR